MQKDNYPTIVSFYTKTWKYDQYARLLKRNCERLSLSYNIKEVTKQDIWFNLTRIKPAILKEIILEEKRPILWIDVDGSLYKSPTLFKLPVEYDLMLKKKPPTYSRTWHVGTMFLNYNDNVLRFLDTWVEYTERYANASDELCLDYMWENGEMDYLNMADDLPETYFYMPSDQTRKRDTVILHRESKGTDKKLR